MQKDHPNLNGKEWQYRSIFDAAADGLIINDLETGCVVEANPAACLMHGYTREEFIGLQLTAFIHPDSQPANSPELYNLLGFLYRTVELPTDAYIAYSKAAFHA